MIGFEIIYNVVDEYSCIIVSNSADSPFNNLSSILIELNNNHFTEGKVLFDSLLSTGNNLDRFIEGYMYNGSFIEESFKNVDIPKGNSVRIITMKYLTSKPRMLEYSILNNAQKSLLKNMIAI